MVFISKNKRKTQIVVYALFAMGFCFLFIYSLVALAQDTGEERQQRRRPQRSQQDGEGQGGQQSFQQDGERQPGQRGSAVAGMIPPELREIMREEGITFQQLRDPEFREKMNKAREIMEQEGLSLEDMKDPEVRKRIFGEAGISGGETTEMPQPEATPAERPQRPRQDVVEERGTGRQRRGVEDEGLRIYLDTVVKNNLFRPLGSGGEQKETKYALTAVISDNSEGKDKAIIEERGGGSSYYVSEGDTFAGNIEVANIEEQLVTLNRSGESEELKLGEGTSSARPRGGGGRRGGANPGGEGENRTGESGSGGTPPPNAGSGGGGFNPDNLPPVVREALRQRGISMEQLRNNPDLQRRIREEIQNNMMRRGGGGRDGGRPQVQRLDSPRRGRR